MRRVFLEGDNFFGWSVPLVTILGIQVRVHLVFVVMIVVELLSSLRRDTIGLAYTAYSMGSLFLLVLLHEFGHCLACRRVGGEADRILMWPLGGLAYCAPPHRWTAALITTLGGPGVNVALIPVTAGAAMLAGVPWEALIHNPFFPGNAIVQYSIASHPERLTYWLYYTNLVLLLFNMLLPMYPMDCGRVLQELLWPKLGYQRSTLVACNVGLVCAVVVGTYSFLTNQSHLTGIAIFAGFSCYAEKQRLRVSGWSGIEYEAAPARPSREDAAYRRAAREQRQAAEEQADVDRILGKIAQTGMASLTRAERKVLERDTERKRAADSARR